MSASSPNVDVRIYRKSGGSWGRVALPRNYMSAINWEILERGGCGNGSIELLARWQDYPLQGNERCDIYVDGVFSYRGLVRLPEPHLEQTETKRIGLFGNIAASQDWRVKNRYVYSTPVDLQRVAQDLWADLGASRDTSALSDIATATGVQITSFDAYGKTLSEAMNQLVDLAPQVAIWGWDAAPDANGVMQNRFYLRPRAQTVKYRFHVGRNISALIMPTNTGEIVNKIHITGGQARQPNLINNGGFEYPIAPDETHGNLLLDFDFELSTSGYDHNFLGVVTGFHCNASSYWSFLGTDASVKTTSHPGNGDAFAYSGSYWGECDQAGETISQSVPIDHTKPVVATAWLRRGNSTIAATCSLYVDGLNASGTVVATVQAYSRNFDPSDSTLFPNAFDTRAYQMASVVGDFSSYSTVTQARIRVVSAGGTNNSDGIVCDNLAVYYRDVILQNAWLSAVSTSPACPAPSIDWTHKATSAGDSTAPRSGGYCVAIAAAPPSGGYAELRSEKWARLKLTRNTAFTAIVAFRTAPGSGLDANVSIGFNVYDSTGNLGGTTESNTFVGGSDGNWHTAYVIYNAPSADVSGEVFIRIRNSSKTYLDNVMVVPGPLPQECANPADGNWWEGAAYERTFDTSSNLLSLPAGVSDAGGATGSIATFGLREDEVANDGVIDKLSAVAFANGYLTLKGQARIEGSVTLAAVIPAVGLDGMVKVDNIPSAPAALVPVRIEYRVGERIEVQIDLNNERPTLAQLFRDQLQRKLLTGSASRAAQNLAAGGSSGTSAYNGGGFIGGGGASDTNLVHLTGALEQINSPKVFKPTTDAVVLAVQREAAGQTSDMITAYDETGAAIAGLKASGVWYTGTHELAETGLGDLAGTGSSGSSPQLSASGVTAGSYTSANITVDVKGRVTAASSGSAGGITQNIPLSSLAQQVDDPAQDLGVALGGTGSSWTGTTQQFAWCYETADGRRTRVRWQSVTPAAGQNISITAPGSFPAGVKYCCIFGVWASNSACWTLATRMLPTQLYSYTGPIAATGSAFDVPPTDNTTALGNLTQSILAVSGGAVKQWAGPSAYPGSIAAMAAEYVASLGALTAAGAFAGNGANVATLGDQAGSNTMTQATAANQPTLVTNVQNGQPAIVFNGTSQYIGTGNSFNLGTSHSVFAAIKYGGGSTIIMGGITFAFALYVTPTSINYGDAGGGGSGVDASIAYTFTSGNFYILGIVRSGSNVTFYVNGVNLGFVTMTGAAATNTLYVQWLASSGSNSLSAVSILEVDVFSGALTAAQAATEMAFLNDQFEVY